MALLTHQSVKPTPFVAAHCLTAEVVLPPGLRCAWSGWAALKAHGHLRTLGDPPGPRVLAYAGRAIAGDLDELGVIPAPDGQVTEHGCWVRLGTALPRLGIREQWADPVVAALDVARCGAQGMEQARLTMARLAQDYQPWR